MKKTKSVLVIILAMALAAVTADLALQGSQSADVILGNALHQEEVEGNYEAAIETYKKLLGQFPDNRPLAAQAQLRIGMCYEKLGHTEAIKAYELVLQKYADQPEQVAAAQARLAALRVEKPRELSVTRILGPEYQFDIQTMSPDGTKIAVVVIGEGQNIAVYDRVTKRTEHVTHFDWDQVTYNAIWSPDGKKVAFQQMMGFNSSVLVSTLDGEAKLIFSVKRGNPVLYDWLPDGSAVVASLDKDKVANLVLIPVTGGDYKTLHVLEGDFQHRHYAALADASPDGKYIVFSDGPKRDTQNIYCISTDGQSLQVLTDHTANDIQPRWSPDGRYVVFLSFRSGTKALWGVRVKNGMPAEDPFIIQEMGRGTDLLNWTSKGLTYTNSADMWDVFVVPFDPESGEPTGSLEQLDYLPPGRNRGVVWSPDGKHFAFFSAEKSGQPGQGNIVVMPANGGQAREYPIPMDTFNLPSMNGLRWLPDSSGLGFNARGNKGATVYRLTLESEKWETWLIPTLGGSRIEWSPSGDSFIYMKGNYGLFKRDLETEEEQRIYKPQINEETKVWDLTRGIKFSRDYKKLAIRCTEIKYENNKYEAVGEKILVMDISTGEVQTIETNDLSIFGWASAWSPDGKNLAVLHKAGEKPSELWIVPLEGGTPNKVELMEAPIKGRLYITDWSPDGNHIAFETRRSTYETFMMKNIIPKEQR